MKKVLITGGAGFIAHHLIYFLLKNTDWNLVSLDRLDYSGNLNRLDNILSSLNDKQRSRVKVIYHDLKSEINPWIIKELGDISVSPPAMEDIAKANITGFKKILELSS